MLLTITSSASSIVIYHCCFFKKNQINCDKDRWLLPPFPKPFCTSDCFYCFRNNASNINAVLSVLHFGDKVLIVFIKCPRAAYVLTFQLLLLTLCSYIAFDQLCMDFILILLLLLSSQAPGRCPSRLLFLSNPSTHLYLLKVFAFSANLRLSIIHWGFKVIGSNRTAIPLSPAGDLPINITRQLT